MRRLAFAIIILCLAVPATAYWQSRDSNYDQSIGGAPFTPASLPNLRVWYEAGQQVFTDAACTTPAANGNTVLCNKDLSGNALNLTAASGGPTLSISAGKSQLQFVAGSSQCLTNSSQLGLYANGSASLFFATNTSAFVTATYSFMEGNSANGNPFAAWIFHNNTTDAWDFTRDTGSTSLLQNTYATSITGAAHVVGFTWDGTTLKGYLDGTATGLNRALASGGTVTVNQFSMGCAFRTSKASFSTINIAGLVATESVLNSTQISQLSGYLAGLQ